jgi:hypothetical protein
MATKPMRPVGVTVISILAGVLGALVLLLGVFALAASAIIAPLIETYAPMTALPATLLAGIIAVVGVIFAVVGILHLVVAYGIWVGAGWAWWLSIILAILGAIGGLLTLPSGVIATIIYALIIWYFMQPQVKAYFGQAPAPTPPPAPPPV